MSRRLFMHPTVINLSMPSFSNQKIALKKRSLNSPKKGLIVNLACDVQNSIWVCIIRVLFQYSRNTWIILKYLVPKPNSVHITRSERQFEIYWGGLVQILNWILELVKPFPVFMRLIKITLQYNLGKNVGLCKMINEQNKSHLAEFSFFHFLWYIDFLRCQTSVIDI